ncbi:hypothetical protein L9Z73_14775, partial [Pseudomonas sp. TNT11]
GLMSLALIYMLFRPQPTKHTEEEPALDRATLIKIGICVALLLDEPLGALDALTRIEMQQLIENLWQKHGFTVLLVTHDVSEAVAIADRVILIEDGEIGLDLIVDLPRPRVRGSHRLAALETQVLNRVLSLPGSPPEPEPVSPLPTQLRWAQ